MYELKVVSFFSAAHSLREYQGKCEAMHGHNWKVEVAVRRQDLDKAGLALDFKELKYMLNSVIDNLDHKDLGQIDFFKKHNPSSENIAYFIYNELKMPLENKGCALKKVTVWEQRDYCASYYEKDS
ncbi:MAG: 6-carboxytetrahydropterin synthase QueD [Candidatus Omnitrophica bacterium]|nr:6-carboxytetrahydropterin synthase QueD [Candidatus Omnitrophota bacterium]